MKIVIFGSTGMTGLCAVAAALKKGYSVRAFVRDPKKIPDEYKDKVEIFPGNVLEPDSVADAVEGMDGVVIALGTGHDMPASLAATSDMSEGTKNILDSMRAKNVKPVSVCLSAFLLFEPEKVPKIFVELTKDHKRMWDAVKESPLDWIAVFPPRIDDTPSSEYTVVTDCTESPGRIISKWDLGSFLVDSLTEPKYYKKDIGICNK
ncbi:hypothetical protein PYW07_007642 [Mythimna separata]|uniref:NAD(P)-binding domain-containing protein n=1 Tax=Mythimna separata TaxID=271217 RepID=A0AAD8DU33_MYTSE|nr:hypothetical protein PYW07_007642 [Mythimna separata]